jgi:hypothetical protein
VPTVPCAERAALSGPVIDAITETWHAKAAYDEAKRKNAGNADALAAALFKARDAERAALRALREHIERHGC